MSMKILDFNEIEKLRVELSSIIPQISGIPKILLLHSFYSKLLLTNDPPLIDSFSNEFIEEYLKELENYSPFYSAPDKTENIIKQLQILKSTFTLFRYSQRITDSINSISKKLSDYKLILNGEFDSKTTKGDLLFPLIGKLVTTAENINYSSVEKLKILISPTKGKDSFIFIPSSLNTEQLEEQTKICFKLALNYLNKHGKYFHQFHEVLIFFENLSAVYNGKSYGIVLIIGLIEQLSLLYNLPYVVNIRRNVLSTGEIDADGNIKALGTDSIVIKVETAFYSNITTFVVPKIDDITAAIRLDELKAKYPARSLTLVSVENLTDLLNRRNLIDIKKQSPIRRTANSIKKNWVSFLLGIMLVAILYIVVIVESDNRPALLENDTSTLFVKNKSGKTLWTKKLMSLPDNVNRENIMTTVQKLVDINTDGNKELLLINHDNYTNADSSKFGSIICYDCKGNELWHYQFKDVVNSKREKLSSVYNIIGMIDTTTYLSKKALLLMATNYESFSSAVFMVELSSGIRIGPTLWHSGHLWEGILTDIDNDRKNEVVFTAVNNGLEKAVLGVIDLENMNGVCPTTYEYQILDKMPAKFKAFIAFPKSDYNKYLRLRNNAPVLGRLANIKRKNKISFQCSEDHTIGGFITYALNYDFSDVEITISSSLRVVRDSLVAKGLLKLPYTDTEEYKNLLRKKILYWDGEQLLFKKETIK